MSLPGMENALNYTDVDVKKNGGAIISVYHHQPKFTLPAPVATKLAHPNIAFILAVPYKRCFLL